MDTAERAEILEKTLVEVYKWIGPSVPEDCPDGLSFELQQAIERIQATMDILKINDPFVKK